MSFHALAVQLCNAGSRSSLPHPILCCFYFKDRLLLHSFRPPSQALTGSLLDPRFCSLLECQGFHPGQWEQGQAHGNTQCHGFIVWKKRGIHPNKLRWQTQQSPPTTSCWHSELSYLVLFTMYSKSWGCDPNKVKVSSLFLLVLYVWLIFYLLLHKTILVLFCGSEANMFGNLCSILYCSTAQSSRYEGKTTVETLLYGHVTSAVSSAQVKRTKDLLNSNEK